MLALTFDHFCISSRAAPGMGDIGDDVVGLLKHPVVAPGDSVMRMDKLDPFLRQKIVALKNYLYNAHFEK